MAGMTEFIRDFTPLFDKHELTPDQAIDSMLILVIGIYLKTGMPMTDLHHRITQLWGETKITYETMDAEGYQPKS